jgi:hypothetical protein
MSMYVKRSDEWLIGQMAFCCRKCKNVFIDELLYVATCLIEDRRFLSIGKIWECDSEIQTTNNKIYDINNPDTVPSFCINCENMSINHLLKIGYCIIKDSNPDQCSNHTLYKGIKNND